MQSFCFFFPHCFLPFFLKSLVAFRPVKDLTEDSVFPLNEEKTHQTRRPECAAPVRGSNRLSAGVKFLFNFLFFEHLK